MGINKLVVLISISAIILLTGCNKNDDSAISNNDSFINITQISSEQIYDQKYANEAKQLLSQKDSIKKVLAVNSDDLLIIGIEIPHHERFNLAKINKELSKEMDEHFKDDELNVELATDKKIILELEKLENKLMNNNITREKLNKELKHISKLLKEQT
ncbi:lipoprotein [Ornithinibacillus halotolerans]|uniref:Lipoprotein n=2 Tax=Ornithinibacillus halotolerans TaxID=1274357 RepID=A0A916WD26_9BACI|nr:lipoprotein [Ornithinibacillus halotolerans]